MQLRISAALALATLATAASAQSIDYTRLTPINGSAKHAGVFDLRTGKFVSAPAATSALNTIYDNTCSAFNSYSMASCEDFYDEGRVPEVVFGGSQVWYPDHRATMVEFGYCTSAPTGIVDIDWELYDTEVGISSACVFGVTAPPKFTAGLFSFQSSALGFPLPGSTASGSSACWIIAFTLGTSGVCLDSGANSADTFTFRFSQNNTPTQLGGGGSGPWLAGNPVASAPGGGTFHYPPGIDPNTGAPCGHGLDTQDQFWINTDGSAGGGMAVSCPGGGSGLATGCYWFGGFPANPFASIYLRIEGDGSCANTGNATTYCTAKVNSLGCTPLVGWKGLPSVSGCSTSSFDLIASNLIGNKFGVWFYGTSGLQGVPFQGGFLCVKAPTTRLTAQLSGGSAGSCNGSVSSDFNAQICSGSDPALVAGTLVGAQCFSRDPASPSKSNLTEGVSFVVLP
ncbi:MAG: hypothetical protein IT453_19965 [Planctomycetes bacterium]|nr:hypothetical protein [Planctomycetota bacterium]